MAVVEECLNYSLQVYVNSSKIFVIKIERISLQYTTPEEVPHLGEERSCVSL